MNKEYCTQLTDGYESALDVVADLSSCLTELQDTLLDTLLEIQGDIGTLSATLTTCVKILHKIEVECALN